MKPYFSQKNNAFFLLEFKPEYDKTNSWPEDAVEVSLSVWEEFASSQRVGFERGVSGDGAPCWVEYTIPQEDLISQERAWRDYTLNYADKEIYKLQDGDKNSTASVASWRAYRKALRNWPEDLKFPNKNFRPTPPTE